MALKRDSGLHDALLEAAASDASAREAAETAENRDSRFAKVEAHLLIIAMKKDPLEAKADIVRGTFGAIGFQAVMGLGAIVALAASRNSLYPLTSRQWSGQGQGGASACMPFIAP